MQLLLRTPSVNEFWVRLALVTSNFVVGLVSIGSFILETGDCGRVSMYVFGF